MIVDFAASHPFTNKPDHRHTDLKLSSRDVTTDGSKTLKVIEEGENDPYGTVKLVAKIGRCLISVGKLTRNADSDVHFNGMYSTISNGNMAVSTEVKVADNLYRISDAEE